MAAVGDSMSNLAPAPAAAAAANATENKAQNEQADPRKNFNYPLVQVKINIIPKCSL